MGELIYDPKRKWLAHPYRSCLELDMNVIYSGPNDPRKMPTPATQAKWDEIKEDYCRICPVLKECRRDTLGEEHGVWGGRDQRERFLLRKKVSEEATKWPTELREFWAAEAWRLHSEAWTYPRITAMTGLPKKLVCRLIAEHEERRAREQAERERQEAENKARAAKEAAKVLGGLERRTFPDKPGSRDLWVRHNGHIKDATYRAHSECGRFIKADIRSARSIVWIPVEDCRVYRPVIKRVERKVGRKLYGRAA